jgi:hypothetical protein
MGHVKAIYLHKRDVIAISSLRSLVIQLEIQRDKLELDKYISHKLYVPYSSSLLQKITSMFEGNLCKTLKSTIFWIVMS